MNTFRKILAIVCGILLVVGIACCIYIKDEQLIGPVVLFAIVYAAYLIVLSRKLKKPDDNAAKSPLRRK